MQFHELVRIFEHLESIAARNEIVIILADCIKRLTPEEARVVTYLMLGEIGPTYAGLQFNVAEKNLIKIIASLCDISLDEVKKMMAIKGDVGLVVEALNAAGQQQQLITSCDTSVLGVHTFLSQLQRISGTGAQERKEQLLVQFARCCDSLSLKFLFRIIIGDLRLGFSDMTLLDAFSWSAIGDKSYRSDLEQAFNVCVDLGVLIEVLKRDGIAGVRSITMTPGIPVRPSSAERLADAQAIVEKLGPCIAQPKLDGFRLQVHVIKNDMTEPVVHFFSRNLQDMSAMFPDLRELVAQLPVQSCIFEGEAIAFDQHTDAFLPFQETVKRKRKHGVDEATAEYPLKLYAFDLLYLDGEIFLPKTHEQRRTALIALFKKLPEQAQQFLQIIEELVIIDAKQLEDYFYSNIAQGLEGLVVKRPDAAYLPGKRNFNWIKLKRQENGSLDDTIDCVILGYYNGSGKRARFGIGALLVGVYDQVLDMFQTVAKIGTGLTDLEWMNIHATLQHHKTGHKLFNVDCSKDLEPDVWVEPRIVCMVRADEITYSPAHKAANRLMSRGLALRFPRFMGERPDKSAADATSVSELVDLFKMQKMRK